MCYMSIDSSLHTLQTYGKLFSQFQNNFLNNYTFFNNSGVGFSRLGMRGGGDIFADQHTVLVYHYASPCRLSVTGEVYFFPCRQLILSFGRRVIYHSKSLRLATFRNRFGLSVPWSSNE